MILVKFWMTREDLMSVRIIYLRPLIILKIVIKKIKDEKYEEEMKFLENNKVVVNYL